jgi:diacylglycerol kinase family enzyme
MNDGKLDVIAFRKMHITQMGQLLFEVVNGRHPNNDNVLYFQTEKLTIESTEDISTDIDGEHGEKLPLEFSVLNKRLEVFVSKDRWHYN